MPSIFSNHLDQHWPRPKSCFPPYFQFITKFSDLWMSGDSEERMRQRRFMRGALGRELQTLGGTSFFSGICLHHHCQSYWHHHPHHLFKSSGWNLWGHDFGLLSSWENHFDWWMSNLSKYISSAPNGTITKVLHHICFCNRKFFKPRWSFFPFLVKTFHQETILGKVSR